MVEDDGGGRLALSGDWEVRILDDGKTVELEEVEGWLVILQESAQVKLLEQV